MTSKIEKIKILDAIVDKIDKLHGKGTIMKLSDNRIVHDVPCTSTGSLNLDLALGIGGIPKGRIIEIYGPESSGKTTLSLHCIAEVHKNDGIAAFIDAEHAFDKSYAEKLGIDTNSLLISQPDSGEQALEIVDQLVKSGVVDIIVIDSVAALVPKSELDGEMGDSKMGLHARLMSQALRKLTANIYKSGCSCIFINQLRDKIGVMFGNPEITTGGNALKFYASVRLDIRKISQIKDSDGNILGNRTKIKVVKNKLAPPFKVVEFDIIYGEGISKIGEIIDLAVTLGIIQKSGSWFSYKNEKIGQGRDSVKTLLIDNLQLANELESAIRATTCLNIKTEL
jgi:recombination protein RecA